MISALLFLSGFAALIYQVLWMRDLTILFGSSAHAAAVVLAVFFGGLAAGSGLYARMSPRVRRPLIVYALLEFGIAITGVMFLLMLDVYAWIYAPLYRRFAEPLPLLVGIKSMLAAVVLGPPTILMGATLPAVMQHAAGSAPQRGANAWRYGMNTVGGAAGAFTAGFYLPPVLGFRGTYLLALAISALTGAGALAVSRIRPAVSPAPNEPSRRRRVAAQAPALSQRAIAIVGLASGLLAISLEVTWFRMFAQVLDNSVYGFSAVLVVALLAFALASLAVARLGAENLHTLVPLALGLSAIAAALQAPIFVALTNELTPITGDDWLGYVRRVFVMAGVLVGSCGFVVGLVLPLLLRLVPVSGPAGVTTGRLLMFNTAGAIAGSLLTTFFVVRWLGVWGTCAASAVAYAALAVWIALRPTIRKHLLVASAALVVSVAACVLIPTLPRVRLDPERGERVLQLWEASHGTVAVTQTRHGRLLRLNNSYSLGGTTDRIERERIQTLIPLLLHRHPRRVFFLGLGTGITAGEALRHPVERVVVCELVPEVVRAADEYFGEWTRGLTGDPRVEIRAEDGRQYLAASADRFDVIVSDLFVPWHAGTGLLYTAEHFRTVAARLRPGGVFAQWLPLFQLNQPDFEVIARTMRSVFPQVVIWRGDFYANRPIVALVASNHPRPLDVSGLLSRARSVAPGISDTAVLSAVLPFYAGNLGEARVLDEGPLNTDDRPIIEYRSPRAQWGSNAAGWFVSARLVRFFERLRAAVSLEKDPYLAELSPEQRAYVDAGRFYYRAIVQRLDEDEEAAAMDLAQSLERLPADVTVSGPFMALDPLVR